MFLGGGNIRCFGCGGWRFRPYGESLFQTPKSNQNAGPRRTALAVARVPSLRGSSGGIASGLLRCTSSRCVWLRQTVAALPPPDKPRNEACRWGQQIKSFRRADTRPLSGAASPRAVHTVQNCGSQPAGDGGLTADHSPTACTPSHCGSGLAREGDQTADHSPTACTQSHCGSEPAREGGLAATHPLTIPITQTHAPAP